MADKAAKQVANDVMCGSIDASNVVSKAVAFKLCRSIGEIRFGNVDGWLQKRLDTLRN